MKDRDIIRRLVSEIMVEAQKPIQQERIGLWTACNDLRPQRPMVWITEIPFGELEDKVELLCPQCVDPATRDLERRLRQKLFYARHLKTDDVVEPCFRMFMAMDRMGFELETREQQINQGAAYIQSHHYEPVIKDFADIEKVKMPEVRHNVEETFRQFEFYEALFGDIMPVVIMGSPMQGFAAWDMLVRWTGVTEALIDLTERPDFIHALMRRLTDVMLLRMDQLEQQGLLTTSNWLPRVGSGAAGYTTELPQKDAAGKIRLMDQWGFATAQIFGDVSPAMHDEFALAYENEVMQRCGLNYYGCCEPLHNKMDLMAKVPRLRKISVSPWSNIPKSVDTAASKYVFSHKPNPAMLAEDRFNQERAAKDIRDRLEQSREMPSEFIMKDISTVRGDPQRVIDWCRIAHEICAEWTY